MQDVHPFKLKSMLTVSFLLWLYVYRKTLKRLYVCEPSEFLSQALGILIVSLRISFLEIISVSVWFSINIFMLLSR